MGVLTSKQSEAATKRYGKTQHKINNNNNYDL
jgi:hypothetical protein